MRAENPHGRNSSADHTVTKNARYATVRSVMGDTSMSSTKFSGTTDPIWERIRSEATEHAGEEPILASFLHATILNHAEQIGRAHV